MSFKGSKKIVIGSGKGGVGKSMLTSALSMLFNQEHKIVAVDCDVDAPNLAIWLNEVKHWGKIIPVTTSARPEIDYKKCTGCGKCAESCHFQAIKMVDGKPVINNFLCEGCGACEAICPEKAIKLKPVQNGKIKIKNTKYNFYLISGQLLPGETGSGKIVTEIKKQAEGFNHDLMVIDSSPGIGCPTIAAFRNSNFAVLITEPTPSGISDLERTLKIVKYFKLPYRVVINKWDINPELTQKIKTEFKHEFIGQISYDQHIFKAISKFKPILETDLDVGQEIREIYKRLIRVI